MPSKEAVAAAPPQQDPRTRAKSSIAQIFKLLDVVKVVYVDDLFEDDDSKVNALIGLLETAIEANLTECGRLFANIPFRAGVEVWDPEVREWWNDSSEEQRERALDGVTRLAGHDPAALDYAAYRVLKDIVPDGVPVIEVAPSAWEQHEGQLAGATETARVLCLVDREFTYSTGRLPDGVRDGVDLLLRAGTRPENKEVIFGLFSHTFTVGQEITRWREIAAARGLATDQFLPFSKQRQASLEEFAVGLEMVTLNMLCDRLKRAATASMSAAQVEAAEQMSHLNVYEFEKMVLDSSWTEGTWEPDILFRIFQVFHRDAARVHISRQATAERVNADVLLAREVSKCRIRQPDPAPEQRWKIRHLELYEDGAVLNGFHSPLRTGDLFAGPQGRLYILLAQPCDLVVRTDSGARKSRYVSLVRVERTTQAKLTADREKALLEKGYDFLATRGVLPYLTVGKDDIGLVRLAEHFSVAAELLDLAVLDAEGRCRINSRDPYPTPPQLSIGWRSRAAELCTQFAARGDTLDTSASVLAELEEEEERSAIWRALMPSFAPEEMKLPQIPYRDGTFDFKLNRIAHFRDPGATRLLSAYLRYLSRDAEEYDFARS